MDLIIVRDRRSVFDITVTTPRGVPIDITGQILEWRASRAQDGTVEMGPITCTLVNPSAGQARLAFPAAMTAGLPSRQPHTFLYELTMHEPGGDSTVIRAGRLTVIPGVG